MGVAGGVENLPWLFTGTLLGMIAVNPPFAALVSRLPRTKFIAVSYRFFLANLLVFAVLLHVATAEQNIWIGRVFFIWASVFNLFVVSVFWGLIVDVFNAEQGKRLFGFIAAGATLGGIFGSSLTAILAKQVAATYLLLGAALLLEAALFCVRRLSRFSDALQRRPSAGGDAPPIGGSVLSGSKARARFAVFDPGERLHPAVRRNVDVSLFSAGRDRQTKLRRSRRAHCFLRSRRPMGEHSHTRRAAISHGASCCTGPGSRSLWRPCRW